MTRVRAGPCAPRSPSSDASALVAGSSYEVLYLASASGSVYRSTDAGVNWTAVGAVTASDVVDPDR